MTLMLDLDPALVARAEAEAAREGTTVAQLVTQFVRERLSHSEDDPGAGAIARASAPPAATPVTQRAFPPLPVFDGGGFPPGVDPCSNASLSAAADAEEDEKYLRIARGELR